MNLFKFAVIKLFSESWIEKERNGDPAHMTNQYKCTKRRRQLRTKNISIHVPGIFS